MTTADNPYESPQGIEISPFVAADRVLTATFVINEAWQSHATSQLTAGQQRWIGRVMLFMLLVSGSSGPFLYAETQDFDGFLVGLIAGVSLGLVAGLFTAFCVGFVMSLWNSRYWRTDYAMGVARVVIDAERLCFENGGSQQFIPLSSVRQSSLSKMVYFRVTLTSDRFYVPATADFLEDDFASWKAAVARRVKSG